MGKSKRIRILRRLIDAAPDEVLLTPAQVELARKLGYEMEPAPPALESTLLTPRTFEPVVDLGEGAAADQEWWRGDDGAPMPRLIRPLTLSEAAQRWRREQLRGALERGGE